MDRRAQLEELVRNPRESLEVEIKEWLDLRNDHDRANLAQALLALANHGGGYVVLGFTESNDGRWSVSTGAIADDSYTQDTVNEIVKAYADPPFHCEAHRVKNNGSQHLVIVVPGGHAVPIRSRRAGPDGKHVRENTYYIRRAGPASEPPRTAQEWDGFMLRCVRTKQLELTNVIRGVLLGDVPTRAAPTLEERVGSFETTSKVRLSTLVKENLSDEKPSRYAHGVWTFAYALDEVTSSDLREFRDKLAAADASITGWPPWNFFHRAPIAPRPNENTIEAWIVEHGDRADGAHSDFWVAAPEGLLFMLRGYQEDFHEKVKPGTLLDRGLPIWRTAECLLHAARLAKLLGVPQTQVAIRAGWEGLAGRRLTESLSGGWPDRPFEESVCHQERVVSRIVVSADQIETNLDEIVHRLTGALYTAFAFDSVSLTRVRSELDRMLRRR